jgi:hypothetical protein
MTSMETDDLIVDGLMVEGDLMVATSRVMLRVRPVQPGFAAHTL